MAKSLAALDNQSPVPESPWADMIARIWALIVDFLLLLILGNLLALILAEQLAGLGHWGVLVGYSIVMAYWGIMNSSLNQGQSLGKRFGNLRVVNAAGRPISLGRSLTRTLILALPFLLSGIKLPPAYLLSPLGHPTKFIITVIAYCSGFGLIYFFLCNRPTRQSLPDLICGTYVVSARHKGPLTLPAKSKPPYSWYVFAVILIILLSAIAVLTPNPEFAREYRLQQQLDQLPDTSRSQVTRGRYFDSRSSGGFLRAELWVRRPLVSTAAYQAAARRAARLALAHYPDLPAQGSLEIAIHYGYNIGLAFSDQPFLQSKTPDQWRREL